jgi:hypothetical protein
MRVRVYRNLKHGRKAQPLYSVMHKGKVVDRVRQILLTDVRFVVNEAGRQRVLTEQRKNVHAFVEGEMVDDKGAYGIDASGRNLPVRISYNPYLAGHFLADDRPVKSARIALINASGITAAYLEG